MPDTSSKKDIYRTLQFDRPVSLDSLLTTLQLRLASDPENTDLLSVYRLVIGWFEDDTKVFTEYDTPIVTVDKLIQSIKERQKARVTSDFTEDPTCRETPVEKAVKRMDISDFLKDSYDKEWFLKEMDGNELKLNHTQLVFMRSGMMQGLIWDYKKMKKSVFIVTGGVGNDDSLARTQFSDERKFYIRWAESVKNDTTEQSNRFRELCEACYNFGLRFDDDRDLLCSVEDARALHEIFRLSKKYAEGDKYFYEGDGEGVSFVFDREEFEETVFNRKIHFIMAEREFESNPFDLTNLAEDEESIIKEWNEWESDFATRERGLPKTILA